VYVYYVFRGPGGSMSLVVDYMYLTTHTRLSQIWRGFVPSFVNYTRLAAASDKVYQLLAHGRWFSPGTLASSITKTCRHDIAEILLKVALSTKSNQMLHIPTCWAKPKTIKNGICCFSVKYVALRRKSKGCWLGIKIMCFE